MACWAKAGHSLLHESGLNQWCSGVADLRKASYRAMVSRCGLLDEIKLSISFPVLPDECRLSMGVPVRLAG